MLTTKQMLTPADTHILESDGDGNREMFEVHRVAWQKVRAGKKKQGFTVLRDRRVLCCTFRLCGQVSLFEDAI